MKTHARFVAPILLIIGLVFFCHNSLLAYLGTHSVANVESITKTNISRQNPGQMNQTSASHENSSLSTSTAITPQFNGNSICVLMYHEVCAGPNGLYLSPAKFRDQMNYLSKSGYNIVTMAEAREMLANKKIPAKTVVLTFDDGYTSFFTEAWPIMKAYGLTGTVYVCTSLIGQPNYLSWDQIKELNADGIEIGSHTRSHISLKQATYQQQVNEILGSKQILDETLGVPCLSFCYPSGAYSDITPTIVKDSGYTSATTVSFGQSTPASNAFLLPRVRVPGWISLEKYADYIPKN